MPLTAKVLAVRLFSAPTGVGWSSHLTSMRASSWYAPTIWGTTRAKRAVGTRGCLVSHKPFTLLCRRLRTHDDLFAEPLVYVSDEGLEDEYAHKQHP